MKLALLGFVLRRVRRSLWRLRWTHLLTAGTVATTLYIFGAFIFLEINLQQLLKGWGDQIHITAYLDKSLDAKELQNLIQRVEAQPEVERVRHISQEQAWRDFRAALGSQSGLVEGLPRDVLPASLEIAIKHSHRDGAEVERFAQRLKQEKAVATIEYPQEWLERLGLIVLGVEWAKWLFGGILFLATFFIVASTVKLATLAHQDEIEIMQLVGASENVIQAPFVFEAMIQGVAGAAISVGFLWLTYQLLRDEVLTLGGFLAPLRQLQFLDGRSIALLLVVGWALGGMGSLFSLRRFVKTWNASRG